MEGIQVSEFGTGFAYCLGLFLSHAERDRNLYPPTDRGMYWFNAAADHLYELNVPDKFSPERKAEIEAWRDKCIKYRLKCENWKEVDAALATAKALLLEWDKLCDVPCEKGAYE